MSIPILTGHIGNNSDLFPIIFSLYVPNGSIVADVTYGKGVFWKNIDKSLYDLRATDLQDGIHFGDLSYDDNSIDVLLFLLMYCY